MTDDLRRRWFSLALGSASLTAVLFRLWRYCGARTWFHPTDYDDGVYATAAALLSRGDWPYADGPALREPTG